MFDKKFKKKLLTLNNKVMDDKNKHGTFKPLPKQFQGRGEVKGYVFTQIKQTDQAFIYEVNTGDSIYYEVFKKVVNRRYACISYPTARGFGIWAWTYMTLEKAEKKFDELNS